MDQSTRDLLTTLAAACREIGSANDLEDRGDAAGAERMRQEAQATMAAAMTAATEDDRERVRCLLGPRAPASFDRTSWVTAEEYIASLLERDPALPPLDLLRERVVRFDRLVAELTGAADAGEERLVVRYTRQFSPSLLSLFRKLVGRNGDPPGWFWIGPRSYHLNLSSDGLRFELREPEEPEPHDVLLDGVLVHVDMDLEAARTGITVVVRSREPQARERMAALLRAALAADGWEPVPH